MLSPILGDLIGSYYEIENHRTPYCELLKDNCFFTEKTVIFSNVCEFMIQIEEKNCFENFFLIDTISNEYHLLLISKLLTYKKRIQNNEIRKWLLSNPFDKINSEFGEIFIRIYPLIKICFKKNISLDIILYLCIKVIEWTNLVDNFLKNKIVNFIDILFCLFKKNIPKSIKYESNIENDNNFYCLRGNENKKNDFENLLLYSNIILKNSLSYTNSFENMISIGGLSSLYCAFLGTINENIYDIDHNLIKKIHLFFKQDIFLLKPILYYEDFN